MNPLAIIALLGAGIYAAKTMIDNYRGKNLEVKIIGVREYQIIEQGLQFTVMVEMNSPYPNPITLPQVFVGAAYNQNQFITTLKGVVVEPKQSVQTFNTVIPFIKLIPIMTLLLQGKPTGASVTISIKVEGNGFKNSDTRTFKLSSLAQTRSITKK